MLRRTVKPVQVNIDKKRRDYKAIVEEVKNEGQDFNAEGRTDIAARVAQQAVPVPKPVEAVFLKIMVLIPNRFG